MIILRNEDCFDTMKAMKKKVDIILTSPPYNNSRTSGSMENHEVRYDIYLENKTNDEYIDWSIDLFNEYNRVLQKNGVILYNLSYGNENPNVIWLLLSRILTDTPFMIADVITWKKKSALPNNVSHNKLTRITEFVFVICRKSEYKTFKMNKKVKSVSKTGQKYYENIFNFVEAANNDGSNPYNKATFSTDFVSQLLDIYAVDGSVVYDSFMGTGTTAVACVRRGLTCIGSELSQDQCAYAQKRVDEEQIIQEKQK